MEIILPLLFVEFLLNLKLFQYITEDKDGKVTKDSSEIPLKNFGSTIYVGPLNPKYKTGKDRYDYAPINSLDAAGYKHDKAYDTKRAVGLTQNFVEFILNLD